jgi:nicotinamide phosphoribosyltransferase
MQNLTKRQLAEVASIVHLITNVHPTGVISIVADTFDFWTLMEKYLPILKPYIESRKPCALGLNKVVFRPDSGDPADIICGFTKGYGSGLRYDSAEYKGAMQCLYETFGSTTNAKGYETLSPFVGLIYGDSITLDRQQDILTKLAAKKYATDCIILGIGSYTYQMISRDTLGFAMKATHSIINGSPIDIYKDPKTGDGTKKSAKGLLSVVYDGSFETYCKTNPTDGSPKNLILKDQCSVEDEKLGCLQEVFLDGKLLIDESLATIRARLHNS